MAWAFVAAALTLLPHNASSAPRPPAAPLPSTDLVYSESFDEAYGLAAIDPSVFADSFNGYCLERTSPTLVPWLIPAVSTDGLAVDAERGAVRLWYRRTDSGLASASHTARLLTLVSADANTSVEWWSLEASPGAGTISVVSHAGNGPDTCLSAAVTLPSGSWVMLVLCYTPTSSALYLGTNLVAVGEGLPAVPGLLVPFTSLVVGSSLSPGGGEIAWGEIDEAATFSGRPRRFLRPGFPFGLDPDWDIGAYWAAFSPAAALGAIGPEEEAARQQRAATMPFGRFEAANTLMESEGQEGPQDGPPPPCGTNSVYDVWITNVACALVQTQGWTMAFTIAGGTNGVLYDVFGTAALTNRLTDAYWVWLTNGYACDRITLTNQWPGGGFYILGLTNDTDGGGLPDAYENLVTHGDIYDPSDDLLTPVVGIQVTDSVAVEQQQTNTATFLLSRLGGRLGQPLTVGCQVSGTATLPTDYTISPVFTTATNVLVTIPAGQTNIQLTVTPIADTNLEGSETVTLTLTTNVEPCVLDAAHTSATAWILEEYVRVYTTVLDFKEGVLEGLEAMEPAPDGQLQFKTNLPPQFPYINVACSGRGTVARINTTNGMVIGECLTAPAGLPCWQRDGPNPSRTTVDRYGNVWVANRDDDLAIGGGVYGSITRIGLIIGGTRYSKTNGVYFRDDAGQYVSNAVYSTCIDRDGDGFIRTSSGLADILPWTNQRGLLWDVDSEGGVSTAEDEAITEFARVATRGTRAIAVDKFNDIWVGGYLNDSTPEPHQKVNGLTGAPVPNSAFSPGAGGYGAVIDAAGVFWSTSKGQGVLRMPPSSTMPPTNWEARFTGNSTLDYSLYGIAADPVHPYIWQTSVDQGWVLRWTTNGTVITNVDGTVQTNYHGHLWAQGLVVDAIGDVWVAHQQGKSHTVGHLDTNATLVGVVDLLASGLFAEYFDNTNLAGLPVLTNTEAPVDFIWTNSPVATSQFSARWSGTVRPQVQGDHVFYVAADAGAAFRLAVNGATIIDNWTNPAPGAVELAGTNWLGTNIAYGVRLEYAHFTNEATVRLSWMEPGSTKEVVPQESFRRWDQGATGVSVDAAGKIWAGCYDSNSAVRIDPYGGPMVTNVVGSVTNVVTNHVGAVDMVVDLGDGSWHPAPYNRAAQPYNYSDMTGFNNRVVNPGLQPLKGYWAVIDDCGMEGMFWARVSWSNSLPTGCSVEVYVRADDDRQSLANATFVAISNNVPLVDVKGRYIEVRAAMTRDDASKQPVIYDLTLYGASSGFVGDFVLDPVGAFETDDASFSVNVTGADPITYQWFVQPPWSNHFALVPGVGGPELVLTNVDQWEDGTLVSLSVSNGSGQTLWLGPAELYVWPSPINLPAFGEAARYPATIHVRGEPTNAAFVVVTLAGLTHDHPRDLDILLVSPRGTKIILMSDAGGYTPVTNATLVFHPTSQNYDLPPYTNAIPSGITSDYSPWDYEGEQQLPAPAPSRPYTGILDDVVDADPNGVWSLYIYDDSHGDGGVLHDSWRLEFHYP